MSDGQYEVWWKNPLTEGFRQVGYALDLMGVASNLASTGYDIEQLNLHLVTGLGRSEPLVSAERWLEDHPVQAVIAAWQAGTGRAAGERQRKMHDRWPALATALDNLVENHAQA